MQPSYHLTPAFVVVSELTIRYPFFEVDGSERERGVYSCLSYLQVLISLD